MLNRWIFALLVFAAVAGVAGAVASVVLVVSAFQFSEWGRVLLYCVTAIVCLEMTILSVGKLRNKETT